MSESVKVTTTGRVRHGGRFIDTGQELSVSRDDAVRLINAGYAVDPSGKIRSSRGRQHQGATPSGSGDSKDVDEARAAAKAAGDEVEKLQKQLAEANKRADAESEARAAAEANLEKLQKERAEKPKGDSKKPDGGKPKG